MKHRSEYFVSVDGDPCVATWTEHEDGSITDLEHRECVVTRTPLVLNVESILEAMAK